MKLNKKKWFKKNILEFQAWYQVTSPAKEELMSYFKYEQIGGEILYNFYSGAPSVVKATARKLSGMKIHEAYFYLRHLKFKHKEVVLTDVKITDALK